ncbi:MAG: type II secretion system protein [Woeseiaceae bacterium]|nr:type II secretion system protein [Woeseiaceae bacterium]
MVPTMRPSTTNRWLARQQAGKQRGAALLLIMLAIMVAATAVLVSRLSASDVRAAQLDRTQEALSDARSALLAYAAVQPDMSFGAPASLPCPDFDDSLGLPEGEAHAAACGAPGTTVIGRLPWRTLGIEPPRDGSTSCLWYVVSGDYKDAPGAAEMLNPDSNGQLRLWGIEQAGVTEGQQPADRIAAMVIAPMASLPGQNRSAAAGRQCSTGFDPRDFVDTDAVSGISNATLSGVPDAIDTLAIAAGYRETHNDRVAVITRADIAAVTLERPDHEARMRTLGRAVTACVADYARNNSGGTNDRRLPWPAPTALTDYRIDAAYDDDAGPTMSGRVPDLSDDSNALTGNTIARVLSDCDPVAVPEWSPGMRDTWATWKDHFYYIVAESHVPTATVPSTCNNCLTVNGGGQYAAVVLFGSERLDAIGQTRNAPPIDADTKQDVSNYLEAANAMPFPYAGGGFDLVSQAASATFNDLLFCIDDSLSVSEC